MGLPKYRKPIVHKPKDPVMRDVNAAFTSDYWYNNVLFEFIVAYRIANRDDPTLSALKRSRLVPPEKLEQVLNKLIEFEWVTTWNNGYLHYAPTQLVE